MADKELAVVYMVAGMSSRFGGKIKQFAKVGPNGETLIENSLKQAIKAGFNKIIFIVGEKTEQPFKEMFGNKYLDTPISYTYQRYNIQERDRPWGTVDAACSIIPVVNCPFVICNGDDIYGENTFKMLANYLKKEKECATVGYFLRDVIPEKGTVNRGIFQIKNKYVTSVKEILNIEKLNLAKFGLSLNSLCSMNIWALPSNVLTKLKIILDEFQLKNKGERKIECLLPTEISKLIETNQIKMRINSATDKWFGVTNPEDEEIVRKQLLEV